MEPEHLSVSQISLYLTCSLKYRFQYVDQLPKPTRSAGLLFGSAVHAALEWLHKEWKQGRTPPLDEVLRVFEADCYAQSLGQAVTFTDEAERDTLILKGKELLSLYYSAPSRPVKDVELSFQLPLINPATGEVLEVPLRGVIDLIEQDGTVVEFKTSQKRWSLADLPDNLQLTAYSYAYELLFGHPPTELRLVNLVRTKNPVIENQTTDRQKGDYERLFHLGREMLKGVRAGVFIPNRGCWLCKDCEYDQDCRDWTGNEDGRG